MSVAVGCGEVAALTEWEFGVEEVEAVAPGGEVGVEGLCWKGGGVSGRVPFGGGRAGGGVEDGGQQA